MQMRTTPLPAAPPPLLPSPAETLASRALPLSHAKSLGLKKKMNEDLVGERREEGRDRGEAGLRPAGCGREEAFLF